MLQNQSRRIIARRVVALALVQEIAARVVTLSCAGPGGQQSVRGREILFEIDVSCVGITAIEVEKCFHELRLHDSIVVAG